MLSNMYMALVGAIGSTWWQLSGMSREQRDRILHEESSIPLLSIMYMPLVGELGYTWSDSRKVAGSNHTGGIKYTLVK